MHSKLKIYLLPLMILALALALIAIDISGSFSPKAETAAGFTALKSGNNLKAIRKLSNALKYCETDIQAHSLLGSAYQNYGWNDEALREYDNTWRLAELNASSAMLNAAHILVLRKDYESAVEAYRRCLLFKPESAEIWHELGQLKMTMGKREEALEAFNKALKFNTGVQPGSGVPLPPSAVK
jgi:Flp pilus assembly protein TadD